MEKKIFIACPSIMKNKKNRCNYCRNNERYIYNDLTFFCVKGYYEYINTYRFKVKI